MTYSKKIIDEVKQWKLFELQPCHYDGTPILSRCPIMMWAKSKQHVISDNSGILLSLEEESKSTASPIYGWDIRNSFSADSDLDLGSPWDLAAKILHARQSKAGRSKSSKKSKSSSSNLKVARDRKKALGRGLEEMMTDHILDEKGIE